MKVFLKKYSIYLFLVILVVVFIDLIRYSSYDAILKIDIDVSKENRTSLSQIFLDRGKGFSGKNVQSNKAKSNEHGKIHIEFKIPDAQSVKKIRFDPPYIGKNIKIKKIYLSTDFLNTTIDMVKLYQSGDIHPLRNVAEFHMEGNTIAFSMLNNDPYILLFGDYQKIMKAHIVKVFLYMFVHIIVTFAFVVLLVRYKVMSYILDNTLRLLPIHRITLGYNFSIIFFILSILFIKTIVTLVAIFYFKSNYTIYDIFFTYSDDLLFIIVLFLIGIIMIYFSEYIVSKNFYKIVRKMIVFLTKFFQLILRFLLILLTLVVFLGALYYILSGYIYTEWGAFIQMKDIRALEKHDGSDELISMLFSVKTLLFVLLSVFISYLSVKSCILLSKIDKKKIVILFFVFVLLLTVGKGIIDYKYKLSTKSPLVTLGKNVNANSEGVDPSLLKGIVIEKFNPVEKQQVVTKKYAYLDSIAKDMNVIIVVMESVRKKNIQLYGYARDTMPELTKIAEHSLVFTNAKVNQPRSAKTMGSLLLGVYPDPRMQAMTWKFADLKNKNENFLNYLQKNNYSLFFGTMQKNGGGDNFAEFTQALSHNQITIEDPSYLKKNNAKNRVEYDERLLSDNFLRWSKKQKGKFAAILWTKSAHMPYISPFKKYKEKTTIDKYDNSLINIDHSIQNILEGLKKQKKLSNTLIVFMGDHGEALGDKMDWGHGNFLYNHSLDIPFVIYNPKIFTKKTLLNQRFQIKDISATLFYLLGIKQKIGQSVNIFSKTSHDKIYLSNVYQDYKLGLIYENYKYIYRPELDLSYIFNLENDPQENINLISKIPRSKVKELREDVLKMYKYQIDYLQKDYF